MVGTGAESGTVQRVQSLELRTTTEPWPLARDHGEAIARHWARRLSENPSFFDGRVMVLRHLEVAGERCRGTMSLERFSAFLYWRDHPDADRKTLDGFVSALLRSRDGDVMLARHAAGTLNAGRVLVPGGFLDQSDVGPDGTVDVDGAAARELEEETGLSTDALTRAPGYLVTRIGHQVSFAIEHRSPLGTAELARAMRAGLGSHAPDGMQELTEIVTAGREDQLDRIGVDGFARLLVGAVLSGRA
jgi:8-oxo-dGTP pyrophosphatase MutT (NUDIX family)